MQCNSIIDFENIQVLRLLVHFHFFFFFFVFYCVNDLYHKWLNKLWQTSNQGLRHVHKSGEQPIWLHFDIVGDLRFRSKELLMISSRTWKLEYFWLFSFGQPVIAHELIPGVCWNPKCFCWRMLPLQMAKLRIKIYVDVTVVLCQGIFKIK